MKHCFKKIKLYLTSPQVPTSNSQEIQRSEGKTAPQKFNPQNPDSGKIYRTHDQLVIWIKMEKDKWNQNIYQPTTVYGFLQILTQRNYKITFVRQIGKLVHLLDI